MAEENISKGFSLNNINATTNYFIKEIDQNELITKNYKKFCATLNYIEHFLILPSVDTGCISISDFALFAWYSCSN